MQYARPSGEGQERRREEREERDRSELRKRHVD